MSSVSSLRGGPPPTVTPDESQRERDIESRHRDEIRELNQTHQAEMTRLQEENKKRVDEVYKEGNAKLNDQDIQHQKEIEAMRAMHTKRVTQT